jgi:hypothetical protein
LRANIFTEVFANGSRSLPVRFLTVPIHSRLRRAAEARGLKSRTLDFKIPSRSMEGCLASASRLEILEEMSQRSFSFESRLMLSMSRECPSIRRSLNSTQFSRNESETLFERVSARPSRLRLVNPASTSNVVGRLD